VLSGVSGAPRRLITGCAVMVSAMPTLGPNVSEIE
jgi:hypothetical protein